MKTLDWRNVTLTHWSVKGLLTKSCLPKCVLVRCPGFASYVPQLRWPDTCLPCVVSALLLINTWVLVLALLYRCATADLLHWGQEFQLLPSRCHSVLRCTQSPQEIPPSYNGNSYYLKSAVIIVLWFMLFKPKI